MMRLGPASLLARLILRLGLRGDDREFLRGDLEEELARRLAGRRRSGAEIWYLRQAVRAVVGRSAWRAAHYRSIRGRWDRDRRGDGFASTLGSDIAFGARALRKHRGFAAGSLLTLALGIGGTAAIFTFVNGLLLRPLPYADGERIVALQEASRSGGSMRTSIPNFADWQARSASFAAMAAYYTTSFNVSSDVEPVRVSGMVASADIFRVLGVGPYLGRTFGPDDDHPDAPRVVVVSHALWQRALGGDPTRLGGEVRLHGRPYTLIGVMPPGFAFEQYEDLWIPMRPQPANEYREARYVQVVARLADGVEIGAAGAEMAALATQLAEAYPEANAGHGATVSTLRDALLGDSKLHALVFLGAVVFVQLIATVNVGNLLLARAAARRREIAVRSALGAGRGRLVRQLLTESLLLAGLGGLLAVPLGRWGRDAILRGVPVEMPRWFDFGFDLRVALFIGLVSALTGVVFGLVPALHASSDLTAALKQQGHAGPSRRRLRSGLVVAEVALALVLLVGAGLMMKGLTQLRRVDPGVDPDGVLTVRLSLPTAQYPGVEDRRAFSAALRALVQASPGVDSVGTVAWLPLNDSGATTWLGYEGMELAEGEPPPAAVYNVVGGDYFETLSIPLTRGRPLADGDDDAAAPRVALVSESTARRFWPGGDPIGERVTLTRPGVAGDNEWWTVVGVVGDVRFWGVDQPAQMSVFLADQSSARNTFTLVAKVAGDPLDLVDTVRGAVARLDPDLPLYEIRTMERVVADSMWEPVVYSWMFTVVAALALSLATVGLYGVVSFLVGRRTHEIGIRMALGARRRDVLGLVVRQAMGLVGAGVALGLVGALVLMGVMSSFLHGVDPRDPIVYALVAATLAGVAWLAAWLPAHRASRIDPLRALREE